MSDIDRYLEPISPDAPCGDVDVGGNTWEIDGLFTPSGDPLQWKPDWKDVADVCQRLMRQCKHIKLAIVYAGVRMEEDGLPGFRDGLKLLFVWLERYWEQLYPQIDREVADPYEQFLQRVNELRNLTSRDIGGVSVVAWLDNVVICESRSFGKLTLRSVSILRKLASRVDGEQLPKVGDVELNEAQLEGAFREFKETAPERFKAQNQALAECLVLTTRIDNFLSEKTGAARSISFKPLEQALCVAQNCLAAFSESHGESSDATESVASVAEVDLPVAAGGDKGMVAGKILSRKDVIKAIQAIREYYIRCEPSSPVPILMERAERFVNMSFMDIFTELAPEAADQTKRVLGVQQREKPSETS